MVWRSGATYSGQILMNLMDGRGNFSWPNGDFYSGEYINGKRNGLGDMKYGDGDSYKARFVIFQHSDSPLVLDRIILNGPKHQMITEIHI